MRLRTTVMRGYLLLAGLATTVAVVSLHFMREMDKQITALSEEAIPAVAALTEIKAASLELSSAAYSYALIATTLDGDGDAGNFMYEKNDRVDRAHEAFNQAQMKYAAVAEPTIKRSFILNSQQHEQQCTRLARELIDESLRTGDPRRLLQKRLDFEKQRDTFQVLIDETLLHELQRMRHLQTRADERLAMALFAVCAVIFVVISAAIALGMTQIRPLLNHLQGLKVGLDRLGPGKYGEPMTMKCSEEVESVVSAVNQLSERMYAGEQAARTQYEQLNGEIGKRKQTEAQLLHEATHDSLTGLSNRVQLVQDLDSCIQRAQRSSEYRFALLFLDLDRFKIINDSLGHHIGDALLVEAARRLVESVRGMDTVIRVHKETTARLGGDEFAILLDGIRNPGRAILIAERIQEQLGKPFHLGGNEVVLSTSIGIALGDSTYVQGSDLLRDADTAMYRAKQAGGAQHAMFDDVMHAEVKLRLQLENDLRKAVEAHQFEVLYQPIVELETGDVIAFESLIRWNHPERGVIPPSEFIPIAEETGLIAPIGRWVLQEACRQLSAWRRELGEDRDLAISVNVSPRQVGEANLVHEVRRVLSVTGLDPRWLRLEITETMIMENAASIHDVLHDLKALGVELHMDDFGTGYSSLSYLHRFPLDVLKIDREFVTNIGVDPEYASVVRAIMTLAHSLRMRVTAEGIETPEQLALVRSLGCNYGQGYLFARPLSPANAWKLLSSGDSMRKSA